ncbi:MAG: hypothetical protein IPL08_07560 [Saprospiraceae bacterium]|nr:hypothetical protein [Saprospiraceae bacterium]
MYYCWIFFHGYELWRTDGTTNGTYLIKDLDPSLGSFSSIEFLKVINDNLYFSQTTMGLGRELYSFDAKQKISSIDVENNQESNELLKGPRRKLQTSHQYGTMQRQIQRRQNMSAIYRQ